MQTTTVLEARHVSVDYGSGPGAVHAVADVSFTLRRGQILGLAGESGSGKSTLAYSVARLLRPPARITAGEVIYTPRGESESAADTGTSLTVEGLDLDSSTPVDVLTLTPAQLRAFRWSQLAFVFQSAMNSLNPVMTVRAQIDDVLRAHRSNLTTEQRRLREVELVKLVGISPDRLDSYPHELSGGMRQRAVIAIALALNPDIIILDEPTTALDVVVQRDILRELLALRRDFGFAVIFITHDLSLLLEIADEVAVMYAGRIVEQATREALYSRACHPYTLGLLNSFPALHGPRRPLTGIPGTPPDLRHVPSGCAFHPRCKYVFAPCSTVFPLLKQVDGTAGKQLAACHLYDDALNPSGPPAELRQSRSDRTDQNATVTPPAPSPTTVAQIPEPPVPTTPEGRHE